MAVHLFLHLGNLQPRLLGDPPPAILLDFDGTLAPIVSDPSEARIPGKTASLLEALARRPGGPLAVVSGRSLDQLRRLVPHQGLILIGNHGLEISGPGWSFLHPEARGYVPAIRRASKGLEPICRRFSGAWVEDKELSASLHFRKVDSESIPALKQAVDQALKEFPDTTQLQILHGRRVLEIRPPVDWDKGRACLWILERTGGRPERAVYMGDDRTDEDAFRQLRQAVTVKVGLGETLAQFFVKDEDEAAAFLGWLTGRNGS